MDEAGVRLVTAAMGNAAKPVPQNILLLPIVLLLYCLGSGL